MKEEFDSAAQYIEQLLKSHDIELEVAKNTMERNQRYIWVKLTPFPVKGNAEIIRKLKELPGANIKRCFHGSVGAYMYHVKFGIQRS